MPSPKPVNPDKLTAKQREMLVLANQDPRGEVRPSGSGEHGVAGRLRVAGLLARVGQQPFTITDAGRTAALRALLAGAS
jgi:hypothetical protein